ncbi:MAG: phosphoribosylglycinamide formyltransferase [Pseudomonadota bacterium]
MSAKIPIAVLLSGRGSNMRALATAAASPDFPARIALVASDRADAPGLNFARQNDLNAHVLDRGTAHGRGSFDAAIDAAVRGSGAELICLAGFMRILGPGLVNAWHGRIINIHPSLLPLYPGLDTHARALADGVKLHGCTVHHVTEGVDEGPIIAQAALTVSRSDTADTLAARVLTLEHQLYPAALAAHLTGNDLPEQKAAIFSLPV